MPDPRDTVALVINCSGHSMKEVSRAANQAIADCEAGGGWFDDLKLVDSPETESHLGGVIAVVICRSPRPARDAQ